jgi:hypothetical protein
MQIGKNVNKKIIYPPSSLGSTSDLVRDLVSRSVTKSVSVSLWHSVNKGVYYPIHNEIFNPIRQFVIGSIKDLACYPIRYSGLIEILIPVSDSVGESVCAEVKVLIRNKIRNYDNRK